MTKEQYYFMLETLHLNRKRLTADVGKDYITLSPSFNTIPSQINYLIFDTAHRIYHNPHIYEIDAYSCKMIADTLVEAIPPSIPELLMNPFYIYTASSIYGYNQFAYSTSIQDGKARYSLQMYSADQQQISLAVQGCVEDIGQKTTFTLNDVSTRGYKPDAEPQEIKDAVFKYIYTFSVLLEAQRTPLEKNIKANRLKNHYAAKAGVSKLMWNTTYVFLNSKYIQMYTDHAVMSREGKTQTPIITRCHIRNITDARTGLHRQVFVSSYVSERWTSDTKMTRNKVKTLLGGAQT